MNEVRASHSTHPHCCKCNRPIGEQHLLLADRKYWHEDCLRCTCCDVRLAELDMLFYIRANMPLCRRDYLRLYGQTGQCTACQKRIQAFEFVMRINHHVYHLNCFCCQKCQMRFCVGDKFYINNQHILCERDEIVSITSRFVSLHKKQQGPSLGPFATNA